MKVEHFIYGLWNGKGIKLIESKGVCKILNEDSMNHLIEYGKKRHGDTLIRLPTEDLLACLHVERAVDEHGRSGVHIHCILIKIADWLEYTQPLRFARSCFMPKTDKPPHKLDQLEVV